MKKKSKDIPEILHVPEINMTKEWERMIYDLYRAVYGNGESIFGQLKLLKEDVKGQFLRVNETIDFINSTIDNYINLDNNYRVKFTEARNELDKKIIELQMQIEKTRNERIWKFIFLLIAAIIAVVEALLLRNI